MYRAEHGAYPANLEELVPAVLDKAPTDLYHAKPFLYRRIDDGYLLYSAGDNGQDDGGSNQRLNIFEGRPFDELDDTNTETARPKTPPNADDISIRVPRLSLKLPKSPPVTDESQVR